MSTNEDLAKKMAKKLLEEIEAFVVPEGTDNAIEEARHDILDVLYKAIGKTIDLGDKPMLPAEVIHFASFSMATLTGVIGAVFEVILENNTYPPMLRAAVKSMLEQGYKGLIDRIKEYEIEYQDLNQ